MKGHHKEIRHKDIHHKEKTCIDYFLDLTTQLGCVISIFNFNDDANTNPQSRDGTWDWRHATTKDIVKEREEELIEIFNPNLPNNNNNSHNWFTTDHDN